MKTLLDQYAGSVVLVVNTASFCGYTPQYKGLEALNQKYKSRGLVVLGFPSNDFGAQEPGTAKEIADFCDRTYAVKFPMMGKTEVKAEGGSPVFDGLAKATGERPKWNFRKYLDRARRQDRGELPVKGRARVARDDREDRGELLAGKSRTALAQEWPWRTRTRYSLPQIENTVLARPERRGLHGRLPSLLAKIKDSANEVFRARASISSSTIPATTSASCVRPASRMRNESSISSARTRTRCRTSCSSARSAWAEASRPSRR